MEKKLQITATAKVQQASSELKKLQSVLTGTGEVITRVGNIFDKNGNRISKTIVSTEQHGNKLYRTIKRIDQNGVLRNLSTSITDVSDKADKTANIFSKWKNVLSFTAVIAGVKALSKAVFETTTKAIDYSESLNLFNVVFKNIEENGETTFSKVGKEATEFQEKLQRNFGANRTESMYFQGLYQSMASSQGIAEEYANIMSENSTKLTYDLSSLFNANQADTAEALRAGIYAGQTKPLRSYGIDITENTLQATLDKMKETNSALDGLSVSSMSQAEKQILRYISVLEQASVAHGDFANTINSPANQLKILQNQFIEMSVAIGNLFLAPLQRFLTLANTVVIVVKQVANSIASLFGIKSEDYNEGIVQLGDAYDDFGDSVDDASGKVGKLKRQILGFDQINNISEPSKSGSGIADNYTGINQALLDSLKGYDNGLDRVKLRAQEIADNIMKWLGFTYNAEKGVWELGKAYDNLLESSKELVKTMGVLKGYSFVGLINLYEDFLEPVSKWTIGTGLPKFIKITSDGLLKTDWNNLNQKLDNFYKALTPFTINIGEGLLWFYDEVLVPLGSFTIGNVVPEFVDLLANGLTILNNTIEVAKPPLSFLWDNFLEPLGEWTGGIAVDVLKDFNSILKTLSKNKTASTITALGVALLLVKKNGGLANSVLKLLPKSLRVLFVSAEDVSTILGDKKATGLTKVMLKLKTGVTKLFSPLKDLGTALNSVNFAGKSTFTGIAEGVDLWSQTSTKLDKFKTTLIGVSGAILSLKGVSSAFEDIGYNGLNASNGLQAFAGSLGTVASSTLIGAQYFGAYGAGIGAVIGVLASINVALDSMPDKYDKVAKSIEENCEQSKQFVDQIINQRDAIEQALTTEMSSIAVHKDLFAELTKIVDSNGKIKEGYEDRVKFILTELKNAYGIEYKVVDGVIQKYNELKLSVEDLIRKKTTEIMLEKKQEEYYNAMTQKADLEKQLTKNREALVKAQENLNKALEEQANLEMTGSFWLDLQAMNDAEEKVEQMEQAVKNATTAYNNSAQAYSNAVSDIQQYQDLLVASTDNNYAEMEKIVEEWNNGSYNAFAKNLTKQTEELNGGKMSKELKEAWRVLASQSYETYETTLKSMDEATRQQIQSVTGIVIEKTPEVETATDELSKKMLKKMKKDEDAKRVGTDIVESYLKGLSKKEQKQLLKDCGVKNADEVVKGLKNGTPLSEDVGIQVVKGLQKGLKNDYWQGQTLSTAYTFSSKILKKFKDAFGIKSPSRIMRTYGQFLLQGLSVGIDKESDSVLKDAGNFSTSLLDTMRLDSDTMNKSLKFSASKFVDFNDIQGSINSNLNFSFQSGIIDRLGDRIVSAINSRPIDVNVNATVDEGVVVKKAVDGINKITETTGECPIAVV